MYFAFINKDPLKFKTWTSVAGFKKQSPELRLKTNSDTLILTGLWLSRTRGLTSPLQSGSEGAAAHREARASRAATSCAAMAEEQQAVWEQHQCQGSHQAAPTHTQSWWGRCVTICGRGLANTQKLLH